MEPSDVVIETAGRAEYSQSGFYSLDLLLIIIGGLVMLVLPVAFVGSFALAVIKQSRGWGISTIACGILSGVATVALLFLARSVTFQPSGPILVKEWVIHELPGGIQVEILKDWEKSASEDGSVLFFSPGKDATFAVIAESRERFANGFPLAAYAEFYAEKIDDQLGSDFQRNRLKKIDFEENDGYLVEMQHLAELPAESVVVGFLEYEDFFYRMIGKSSPEDRDTMEEIMESIRFRGRSEN